MLASRKVSQFISNRFKFQSSYPQNVKKQEIADKMSNDFFNLNSDEESDEEEKEKKRETEKAIRKWDWDLEENFELYYSGQQKQTKEVDSKRFKSESQHSASNVKPNTSNAISAASSNLIHNKNPYIEKVDPKSSSSTSKRSTKLLYNLNGHSAPVNRIHWRKGYLNKPILLSSSMDRKIIIWDLSNPITAKSVRLFENVHSKGIRNAIWSLNQTEIVSVSYDQTCALTDAENGKEKNRIELSDILTAVCIHPTNEYLIQIGSKNCIYTWDIREKAINKTYNAPMGLVQDIVFMNNDQFISCGDVVSKESAIYSVIVWDMGSGARLSDQIFHEKFICTSLAIHPHRALFYAQTHGNYIAEFASRPPFKMNRHRRFESASQSTQGYYIGCNIDPSGSVIASGSADGRVFVYSLESGQMIERIDTFSKQPCLDVKFRRIFSNESSDSDISNKCFLAASSWTGLIRVFQF